MIKDDVIKKIVFRLADEINANVLQNALYLELNNYDVVEQTKNELVEYNQSEDQKAYQMFFITKKVEGCTDRSLAYYKTVLKKFMQAIYKPFTEITSNDIRYYIATRSIADGISKCTQDNERRVISTFFAYLTTEEYISKNPMLSIKKIKEEKRIKKPFTEIEMELIRRECDNKRDLALIDFMFSTGCRVAEVQALNIEDVNMGEGICIVFGKGQKERSVFLNSRCKLALTDYLEWRGNPKTGPLFASLNRVNNRKTYKNVEKRVGIQGIETSIRETGKRAGVEKCHPHRFRRTTATIALNRGMPIDQVREMLGHESIATTTIYALTDKENLQSSHKKYVV